MAKRSLFSKKFIFSFLNLALILALAGFGGYYFKKYQDVKDKVPNLNVLSEQQKAIDEVAKLYNVPGGEKPATGGKVTDKESIKKQYPILQEAENGDYLFLYEKAKLAILYRPSTNKIIKAIPYTAENAPRIRVIGTQAERTAIENTLKQNNLTYIDGGDAKVAVTGSLVVDLRGTNGDQAKKLAELVKGQVGNMPDGQDKPTDADLLIIVGPTATP